jgi:hypothetical protein
MSMTVIKVIHHQSLLLVHFIATLVVTTPPAHLHLHLHLHPHLHRYQLVVLTITNMDYAAIVENSFSRGMVECRSILLYSLLLTHSQMIHELAKLLITSLRVKSDGIMSPMLMVAKCTSALPNPTTRFIVWQCAVLRYYRHHPALTIPHSIGVRTQATFPYKAADIFSFIWELDNRKLWDEYIKEVRVVESVPVKEPIKVAEVVYMSFSAPFPVSHRDFCNVRYVTLTVTTCTTTRQATKHTY